MHFTNQLFLKYIRNISAKVESIYRSTSASVRQKEQVSNLRDHFIIKFYKYCLNHFTDVAFGLLHVIC